MVSIRQFNPTNAEYAAIAAVHNAAWPDERLYYGDRLQEADGETPEGALNQRFVAQNDGEIIGEGQCHEDHNPGLVHINFCAHPDHAASGAAEQLYETLIRLLGERSPPPVTLAAYSRDDRPEGTAFLLSRGFTAALRLVRSYADLAQFNQEQYRDRLQQVEGQGIRITSLHDYAQIESDWKPRLWRLYRPLLLDVPGVEPPAPITQAQFERIVLTDPALDDHAWFIAMDGGGELVGMSNLWINDSTRQRLDTGLTGVLPAWRRRGIATALKVHIAAFAQDSGARTLRATNEANNPMLSLNRKLGFIPQGALVFYRCAWEDLVKGY